MYHKRYKPPHYIYCMFQRYPEIEMKLGFCLTAKAKIFSHRSANTKLKWKPAFCYLWIEMVKQQHNYKVHRFCLGTRCLQLTVHLLAMRCWFPR